MLELVTLTFSFLW